MAEHESTFDNALTILIIEDNPGDARFIRELLRGVEELSERASPPGGPSLTDQARTVSPSEPAFVHETRLSDGLERLSESPIDVILLDLNLPDSDGLATVETVRAHANDTPIVVLTGLRDRKLGLEALRRGAEEYLVKDEINADMVIRSVHHAIERKAHERELERQRNQLATLNSLNELVHEISHLVIESTTREQIEQLVCEHLADAEAYEFAWIGEINPTKETVTIRAEAGVNGYLDSTTIRIDDSDEGQGPTGKAIRTGEVHVVQNILEETSYAPWVDHAREHGVCASAAIPIEYEGTIYGVLNIYSAVANTFDENERLVIARLGKVIGHAINAIERKQALLNEEVVELRFKVQNVLGLPTPSTGKITFDRTIPLGEDNFLQYGTVTQDAMETLTALVSEQPHYRNVTIDAPEADESRFDLQLSAPPAISSIAAIGGRINTVTIEDGDINIVVHIQPGADVRRIVDAVKAEYPCAEMIANRQTVCTTEATPNLHQVLHDQLTEKQRTALETAYFAGFFDWPRRKSGEDIATSMGVSPSTFHEHIRTSQRKLIRSIFDNSGRT
ncbi:bacterio-opsin activator domain-containing protein [Haladaptatus sp. ZSTT2]|uniref:bacterio-opsin activator domain-containing protein n=1 Tax=Haladaptatus sp. ZSTT2 TaxID=3120515 RepID=UPI00300F55DB